MASNRNRDIITRQWRIWAALASRRHGMTARQLAEEVGVSRATIYRNLEILVAEGVPIVKRRINGEVRHCLLHHARPLSPTTMQIAALHMARRLLRPLAGTRILDELDALLAQAAPSPTPTRVAHSVSVPAGPDPVAAHLRIIDRAIDSGRRVRFSYTSADARKPETRRVDPIGLRLRGVHTYLIAHDPSRGDLRTFKLARLGDIAELDEPAGRHPEYDEEALFEHSIAVWSGEVVDVAVRIAPEVARFVSEWPLSADQRVEPQADGSVVARARVAGIVEPMRWVLRWGAGAEALEPASLRDAVRDELARGLARYR